MDRSQDRREVPMFEVPSHCEALKLKLDELQDEMSESHVRSRWLTGHKLALAAAMCVLLVAAVTITTLWWPFDANMSRKDPSTVITGWYYPISEAQEWSEFEKTHQKYQSVPEALASAVASDIVSLKPEVKVPKDTLGAKLLGVYVPKPGQVTVPDVTLRYSNGMTVTFTRQTAVAGYEAQVEHLKSLDAQGLGHHTTDRYVTKVSGYQAIALERGQNADGSKYPSDVQWDANGVKHMVTARGLRVADLMKVADSMY